MDTSMERLFESYADLLFRVAYKITGDRENAKDITQETFIRFARTNPALPNESALKAYLVKTATNLAYNENRHRQTRTVKETGIQDSLYQNNTDPFDHNTILHKHKVTAALDLLPEKQRLAITYRFFSELTIMEIMNAMGISDGSVKTHLKRGLAKLKEILMAPSKENLYEL